MQQFFELILKQGYLKLDCNESGVDIIYSAKGNPAAAFCFVDADVINLPQAEHYAALREDIYDSLKKLCRGNVSLIMVISSRDINNARKCVRDIEGYWLLNSETKRLIIYDGQPQELCGMRHMLEYYLENGELPNLRKENMTHIRERGNLAFSRARGISGYFTMSNIIIAANIIVYLIVALGGDVNDAAYIESKGGLTVDGIKNGEYYRLFTSLFLHYGATHLFYNMLFIFSFGNTIEPYLGRIRLALVYFGGGLGGGVCAYLYNTDHNMYAVTAGASGAAYALMGGLIALAILDAEARRFNNPVPLIIIAILFISEGFTSDSNVANSAHIGGIVIGFIIACIVIIVGNMLGGIKKNKRK